MEYKSVKDPDISSDSSQDYVVHQVTLAFLMLRACYLLFCRLPLACSSGNLCLVFWQCYFKVSVEIFFPFCSHAAGFVLFSHDLASANPDTVVTVCFHEKN